MRVSQSFESETAALQTKTLYLTELLALHDQLAEQIDAAVAPIDTAEDAGQVEDRISHVSDLFGHIEGVQVLAEDAIAQLAAWLDEAERRDEYTAATRRTARGT